MPSTHKELIEVTLEAEAVIAGRVTWRGKGVATKIEVVGEQGRGTPFSSNELGAFQTSGLGAGRFTVIAWPPGVQVLVRPRARARIALLSDATRSVEEAKAYVTVASGQAVEVELELGLPDRQLFGRVAEGRTGLPGVAIRVAGLNTTTDAEGRYSIAGLPAGLAAVTAERSIGGGKDSLQKTVSIAAEAERLDFDFSSYDISGRAVLDDGSPVAGAIISFRLLDEGNRYGRRTTTRYDGMFALRLAPGEYRVTTEHGGSWIQSRNTVQVRRRTSKVVVRFGHNLRLSGTVSGLSTSDLALLQVEAVNDQLAVRQGVTSLASAGVADFSIRGLDSGRWTVVATVGNSDRRTERKVTLAEDDEWIELAFERLSDLSGTVLIDGQPLKGNLVLLAADSDLASARGVWTRYDGSYRFADLADGTYTLAVGAETRTVSVRSDSYLTIDLRSGRVEGFVADARSAQALSGATVHVWPMLTNRERARALGVVRTTFVDDKGRFALNRLPEGTWALAVDGVRGMRRIDVRANGVVQVSVP